MKLLILIISLLSSRIVLAQESPAFSKAREIFGQFDRREKKLVLIGDVNHDADTIPIAIARALFEIKSIDNDFDCLFLEEDQRLQPALDEFMRNPETSVLAYRKPMGALVQSQARDLFFMLFQRKTNDQLKVQAKNLRMKIFAVDIDRSTPEGKTAIYAAGLGDNSFRKDDSGIQDPKAFARETIEMRNRVMANGIARRFSDGSCTKGVAFVGNTHVAVNELAGEKIESLYEILNGMNIRSIVASTFQLDCSAGRMDSQSCIKLRQILERRVLFSKVPTQHHMITDFYILSN